MHEQDYWMNRANQDTVNGNLTHEAQMNYWTAKHDYIIIEALKPKIMKDGNQWCCLYGDNLQEGVAGFGDTPIDAVLDFNKAFYKK